MPEPVTTLAAITKVLAAAPKAAETLTKLMDYDYAGNLRKILSRAIEAGMRPTRDLPGGLLADFGESARTIDDEICQDIWAEVLRRGLEGEVTDGEMRWALSQLKTLPGEAAVLLAATMSDGLSVVEPMDGHASERLTRLRWARDHLEARGLLLSKTGSSFNAATNKGSHFFDKHAWDNGFRSRPVMERLVWIHFTFGTAVAAPWAMGVDYEIQPLSKELARIAGIRDARDYGIYRDCFLSPDDARDQSMQMVRDAHRRVVEANRR